EEDRPRVAAGVEDAYPLAMLQAGMVFHSQYTPGTAMYHDVFRFRLRAPFEISLLQAAMARLVANHPVLRTSFDFVCFSQPVQLVHTAATVPSHVDDLRQLPEPEREARLLDWLAAEQAQPFDWTRAPLLRASAHRLTDETFSFNLSLYHAILDGWSIASLVT